MGHHALRTAPPLPNQSLHRNRTRVTLGRIINSNQTPDAMSVAMPDPKTRLGAVTVDFWDIRG
jgi:hypothetical protein